MTEPATAEKQKRQRIVWTGARALRRSLVPIDSLEPFPGNPRLGDVESIRGSLRRFGQVKPILVDGSRIIAGHHFLLAAKAEGFTHIAVLVNEFADEDEARAYLLADNRTSDNATYNLDALTQHLSVLAEIDALEGTGYTRDDLDDRLAELRQLQRQGPPTPPAPPEPQPPTDARELVLLFSPDQRDQIELWIGIVAKEKGTQGPSETVYAALEIAARTLHDG